MSARRSYSLMAVRATCLVFSVVLASMAGTQADAQGPAGMRNAGRGQQRPLTAKELRDLNPARVLIGANKDLRLDASQRARLDTMSRAHEAQINAEFRTIDSLRKVMNSVPSMPRAALADSARFAAFDAAVARAQAARRDVLGMMVVIKEEFDAAALRALEVLNDEQRRVGSGRVQSAMREVTALLRSETR